MVPCTVKSWPNVIKKSSQAGSGVSFCTVLNEYRSSLGQRQQRLGCVDCVMRHYPLQRQLEHGTTNRLPLHLLIRHIILSNHLLHSATRMPPSATFWKLYLPEELSPPEPPSTANLTNRHNLYLTIFCYMAPVTVAILSLYSFALKLPLVSLASTATTLGNKRYKSVTLGSYSSAPTPVMT